MSKALYTCDYYEFTIKPFKHEILRRSQMRVLWFCLHKSFPLRISSVNVTKSARKLQFLRSVCPAVLNNYCLKTLIKYLKYISIKTNFHEFQHSSASTIQRKCPEVVLWKRCSQKFYEKGIFKKVFKIHKKIPMSEPFFYEVGVASWRPTPLLKRDSGTTIFLWLLETF